MNPKSGWIEPEPYAASALWARRLGLFSIPVALIAVLVLRAGRVEPEAGLAALASAGALASLAVLLALIAFGAIWFKGSRGAGAAMAGAFAACLVLAAPLAGLVLFRGLPPISDITTDPANPLQFQIVSGDRRASDNPATYPGAAVAAQQALAYPDIGPLQMTVPAEEAHALALQLVEKRRWRVLSAWQQGDAWRIEAVATTPVIRLAQDVVIETRRDGSGSRVEMRSASRWGRHDLGTNARRVRDFLAELAAAGD